MEWIDGCLYFVAANRNFPNRKNMQKPGCLLAFFGIFAAAGLLCGIAGTVLIYNRIHTKMEGVKTTGKIIEFNQSGKGTVAPIVSYTNTQGRVMVYHSDTYSNFDDFEIGDPVTVWYLPSDPESVIIDGETWLGWLPLVFFLTHGGVGFGGIFWAIRKMRRMKWLQEQGTEIRATYTYTEGPTGKNNNYAVHCDWKDPISGKTYKFKSEWLNTNPVAKVTDNMMVRVMINPDNPDIYWVDTDSIAEGLS